MITTGYRFCDRKYVRSAAGSDIYFTSLKEANNFAMKMKEFIKLKFNKPYRKDYEYTISETQLLKSYLVHDVNLEEW